MPSSDMAEADEVVFQTLAKEILSGRFAPKDIIRVDAVEGRITFEQVMEAEVG